MNKKVIAYGALAGALVVIIVTLQTGTPTNLELVYYGLVGAVGGALGGYISQR